MREATIQVSGVGKRFVFHEAGPRGQLKARLEEAVRASARRLASANSAAGDGGHRHIWALEDVTFELESGDALGLVGANGAGKSVLLKILARVIKPTVGRARLRGRVGSLLEAEAGLHDELTGRENVFLSGTLLGMTREGVRRRFDDIVDFSGLEEYLDVPVKRYSN